MGGMEANNPKPRNLTRQECLRIIEAAAHLIAEMAGEMARVDASQRPLKNGKGPKREMKSK